MSINPYSRGERPLHEYLRIHAAATPTKAAIIWYGREISYAELDRLSNGFAHRLAQLGVRKGDKVILFLQNCPQYVIAHFGIQKLGGIVSPCSPLFKEHEFAYQVGDLGAKVIVAGDDLIPTVRAATRDKPVEHVFAVRYADFLPAEPTLDVPAEFRERRALPVGVHDFLGEIGHAQAFVPPEPMDMDDVALMTYTSGTTGMPKGAMLTYRNALFKTAAAAQAYEMNADEVILAIAPLYHIAGMVGGLCIPAYSGATVVLLNRFDPVTVLQAIDRYRVTWWYSMAPMLVAAMQAPASERYSRKTLRTTLSTSFGIQLTKPLAEQWSRFANDCAVYEAGYGLSETHTMDAIMPRHAVKWGTHGKASPGVDIRIVDPVSGAVLPAGEQGEIVTSSIGIFKGYWNKPAATGEILRDGWIHTGDIGVLDSDGYLTFTGRTKEMIKVSGYSVFPEEVEMILIKHPDVRQAAVIGVPDSNKGEIIKAFIVLKPEAIGKASEEAIIGWCKDNMSHYKVPRAIAFRDALPATGAGKVLRRLLKDA